MYTLTLHTAPSAKLPFFSSYAKEGFGDEQQIQFGHFIGKISCKGAKIVASNSQKRGKINELLICNYQEFDMESVILKNGSENSENTKKDFIKIVEKYPETLKCIPLLPAVRANEIYAMDSSGCINRS